jgi:hypothetical protein
MQKDSKDNSSSVDYGNANSDKGTNVYSQTDDNTSSLPNQPHDDYFSQNYPSKSFHDGSGHNNDDDNDCELEMLQRVRFFNGQLLYSEDLNQLSKYFNNKHRLLNQQIVGINGIVCGMKVENVIYDNGCLNINISKGFAIDCCGKEIIIAKDCKYTMEFPKQIFNEKIYRIGLFVARNEIKKSTVAATSLECEYENNFENSGRQTRVEEGYKLFLKPIENNFLVTEFNKKSYCISDKVIIEVWDPDNILKAKKDTAITIKSNYTEEEIEIQLKKLDKDSNFYRGELSLSLDQSIKYSQLRVHEIDTITAKLGEYSLEKAYVNSTNSFIYNEKKRINNYLECNQRDCNNIFYSHQSDQSTDKDNHGILIAIIKNEINGKGKEGSNLTRIPSSSGYGVHNIFVDKEESLLCRKVIYKNQMLYDLFTNKTDCKSKTTAEELDKTILLVSKEVTYKTNSITQGHYKIMETINIFESSDLYNNNKELEFPPFVYLGMVLPGNKNNETILFNEDIYKESQEKIVIDGHAYAPEPTDNYTKNGLEETILLLENNLVFKPIDIRRKEKSFRILIAKPHISELNKNKKEHTSSKTNQNESDKEEGSHAAEVVGKKEEITLRWWAICKFKNS